MMTHGIKDSGGRMFVGLFGVAPSCSRAALNIGQTYVTGPHRYLHDRRGREAARRSRNLTRRILGVEVPGMQSGRMNTHTTPRPVPALRSCICSPDFCQEDDRAPAPQTFVEKTILHLLAGGVHDLVPAQASAAARASRQMSLTRRP